MKKHLGFIPCLFKKKSHIALLYPTVSSQPNPLHCKFLLYVAAFSCRIIFPRTTLRVIFN